MNYLSFGNQLIPHHHLFLLRKNVMAFPSFKPVAKGHVLVAVRRNVPKLSDLTQIETIDLWMTAAQVSKMMTKQLGRQCSITVQNGQLAGQSIPQVHLHIIPKMQSADSMKIVSRQRQISAMSDQQMSQLAQQLSQLFMQFK